MSKTKYILGWLFTVQIGLEYASVSRQVASWLTPLLPILLLLLGGTWLIVSGHTGERVKLNSVLFWKYYLANSVACVLIAFISVGINRTHPEIIKVNGVDVNIAYMMKDMKKIIPDNTKRREYCVCVATKITSDGDIVQKYKHDLETGKISNVVVELLSGPTAIASELNNCLLQFASTLTWNPNIEKGIRKGIAKQIRQLDLAAVVDTSAFCDCFIEELKKIPIKEWMSTEFAQSQKRASIDSLCLAKSKLK